MKTTFFFLSLFSITFYLLTQVNAISNTNSTNITEISTQRTSQSTYSAAAGIAREFNNDCYIAGAALIAAAVILL